MDDPQQFRVWTTSSDINNTENLMQNESKTSLIQSRKNVSSRREVVAKISAFNTAGLLSFSFLLILDIMLNHSLRDAMFNFVKFC